MHKNTRTIRRSLAIAALVGVGVLGSTACDVEHREDVDPALHCGLDAQGHAQATGTVTNHSSKSSTYFIEVQFSVGNHALRADSTAVDAVEPNTTVAFEATVFDAVPEGLLECHVVSVTRVKA